MTILEEIIAYKRKEVKDRKELYPTKLLEQSLYFNTPTISLKEYILKKDKSGIIAEFKRKSPSKGDINKYASLEEISIGYMQAGASALSVLTDSHFFGGSNKDLETARKFNYCPILRKDFIIDEYQIIEAKSIGADAILLIAACLSKREIESFTTFAKKLDLEVLLEIHQEEELEKLSPLNQIIGVNNRDLNSFKTDINVSINLSNLLPKELIRVSESGISNIEAIKQLKSYGFQGFLIGETFMQAARPEQACKRLIQQIKD